MKKSRSLRRMVALISLMLVLFAIVMPTLYAGLSTHIFAEAKLRELYPRTQFLAELAAEYFASGEPMQEYEWLLTMDSRQWDAAAYLLDAEGNILSGTDYADGGGYASEISDFSALAAQVLAGETLSSVSHTTVRMERGNSRVDMLIVGVPVQVDGQTMGAVLMLKPLKEILSAMSTLTTSLWLASLAVFALMLPLAYLFSKRISRPLAEMRDAALRMAGGDFSVRADDGEKGEIGDLARALNHLSSELGRTISELTAERNRALGIVNALGEGILVVDSQLRPTQTNPSLQTILLSAGDGQSEAALPPEIWEDFRAALRENREIDRPLALGRLRLHVTIIPTGGQSGPVGAIGVFRDETQAYHLEQTRREYVANVSHELRTPLTAVRALVEPLRDGLIRTDEKRQETYGIILRETMRLSRLVDDMLELSRLQSGGAALQKMLFTAAPQIRETASIYAAKAEKNRPYPAPGPARRRSAARAGQSGPDGTGIGCSAGQRLQLHAPGQHHCAVRKPPGAEIHRQRGGQRPRHRAGGPPACVRPLLQGGQGAQKRRHGAGPCDCPRGDSAPGRGNRRGKPPRRRRAVLVFAALRPRLGPAPGRRRSRARPLGSSALPPRRFCFIGNPRHVRVAGVSFAASSRPGPHAPERARIHASSASRLSKATPSASSARSASSAGARSTASSHSMAKPHRLRQMPGVPSASSISTACCGQNRSGTQVISMVSAL